MAPDLPLIPGHSYGSFTAKECVFYQISGNQQNNRFVQINLLSFGGGNYPDRELDRSQNVPISSRKAQFYPDRDDMFAYSPDRWYPLFCDIPVAMELIYKIRDTLQDSSEAYAFSDLNNDLSSLLEALQSSVQSYDTRIHRCVKVWSISSLLQ